MLVAGVDEVGRGALAGPLLAVAAVVNLAKHELVGVEHSPVADVKDSKKFGTKEKMGAVYFDLLRSNVLVDFGIGEISSEEIDKMGMGPANELVFERALEDLHQAKPEFVYIDGINGIKSIPLSAQKCMPKGDALWWPVSAASILAKVIRDDLMRELHRFHPEYGWSQNAGYGSPQHLAALKLHGPSPKHRRTFITKLLGAKVNERMCNLRAPKR